MTIESETNLRDERKRDLVRVRSDTTLTLPPRKSYLRMRLQAGLYVLDIICLIVSVAGVGQFWLGKVVAPDSAAIVIALISFYSLVAANAGAFSVGILYQRRVSILLAIRSVLLAAVGVMLAVFLLKAGAQISRMQLIMGGGTGAVLVGFSRLLYHGLMLRLIGSDLHSEVLIIDDADVEVPAGVHVVKAEEAHLRCDFADPMMLDRLGRLLAPADRVVIACPPEKRRAWSMMLKCANIQGEILTPDLNGIGPLGTGSFASCTTVLVSVKSLEFRQRLLKRVLDIGVVLVFLIMLFPLLLVISVAIKLDSPGPILFVQDRVGLANRLFGIYKFRSMRIEAYDLSGTISTGRQDKRVTRVGRFIRMSSIDELPQIFNVLKGEMSLVGPRPHALGSLAGDRLFWEIDERYWHRHVCKPGMTGLAQIRGYRGATNLQSDLVNRLQADLEYVANWTILRDISILIATLRVVIHRNAY